jgi:hypothetical protein
MKGFVVTGLSAGIGMELGQGRPTYVVVINVIGRKLENRHRPGARLADA